MRIMPRAVLKKTCIFGLGVGGGGLPDSEDVEDDADPDADGAEAEKSQDDAERNVEGAALCVDGLSAMGTGGSALADLAGTGGAGPGAVPQGCGGNFGDD